MSQISQILGVGVIVLSLSLFFIGLPVQAYKNYKRKSTKGLSLSLFSLNFLAYVIWLWYGLLIKNLPIVIPNIPAIIFGAIILYQFFMYRKKQSL